MIEIVLFDLDEISIDDVGVVGVRSKSLLLLLPRVLLGAGKDLDLLLCV